MKNFTIDTGGPSARGVLSGNDSEIEVMARHFRAEVVEHAGETKRRYRIRPHHDLETIQLLGQAFGATDYCAIAFHFAHRWSHANGIRHVEETSGFGPGLFVSYPRRDPDPVRLVYRVWVAVVVGLVLVYARWWAWYGGAVWGPRFFLFASLPAALVLARWTARADAHSTWANAFVLTAVALSCWVGASGVVFQGHGSERLWANDFELEYLNWYVPEYSVLWLPFVVPKPLGWEEWARLAVFAAGFAYLAGPVVRVLAVRGRGALVAAWRAFLTGPRWRV